MRTVGIGLFTLSLLAGPVGSAFADDKKVAKLTDKAKGGDSGATAAPAAAPTPATATDATAAPPPERPKSGIDELLENATQDTLESLKKKGGPAPKGETKEEREKREKAEREEALRAKAAAAKAAADKARTAGPTTDAPVSDTDDNNGTAVAAGPERLTAVTPSNKPRHRGPYELSKLDCRVLDGAGIERLMPGQITSGEEPDIICRVIVTQPGDILADEHTLTLSVLVNDKESFRQQRKVRMSSVGRRALVFLIPSDKIASDNEAKVRFSAQLSAPAVPPIKNIDWPIPLD